MDNSSLPRPRLGSLIAFGCLATSLAACDDPAPLPEFEVESGELIDYQWDPALQPCAGNVAASDAFVLWVAEQLGLDATRFEQFTYRWLQPETFDALFHSATGGIQLGGYAGGNLASSVWPVHYHEIVHLVDFASDGSQRRHRVLIEGLAVAFEEGRVVPRDPRPYIDGAEPLDGLGYAASGAFVTYLLGRFGPAPLIELMDANTEGESGERLRQEFAAVYGEGLDAVVEEFAASTTCPEDAFAVPLPPSCAGPTIPWIDADRWILARSLDCADDDVVGDADGEVTVSATFDVDVDASYSLAVYGDSQVSATVVRCGPCRWLETPEYVDVGERREVELAPGRYSVQFSGPGEFSSLAGFAVTRVDS